MGGQLRFKGEAITLLFVWGVIGRDARETYRRWNYRGRVYLQHGNCLDLFLQLPHPFQRRSHLLSDVLQTRTYTHKVITAIIQLEMLTTRVRFCVLVAPTCSAPVLRFEFPLPTLALSKSPAACSVWPLFCTGVAVFVPSKQFFFFFIFHLFLVSISYFYSVNLIWESFATMDDRGKKI